MYNDFYTTPSFGSANAMSNSTAWLIIAAVISVIGGIAAYVMFVSKPKDEKYEGIVAWLYDFLNFKTYFIEVLLKVLYIITALFITLGSFSLIGTNVAEFFGVLIFGNLAARIAYELILMLITVVTNTTEINQKLSNIEKIDNKKSENIRTDRVKKRSTANTESKKEKPKEKKKDEEEL